MTKAFGALVAALLFFPLAGCSDSTKEKVHTTADEASARAAAEAMRATLKAKKLPDNQTVRDLAIMQAAADDVPGNVRVEGLADNDGDGKDDDGNADIVVGKSYACVTAHDNGEVEVSGGKCG
jgi:hypothetical protein